MTDRLKYIFLELPSVKSIDEGSSDLAKLCYALHNMTALKSRPKEMQAEIFELLFNSAEIAKFTPEEKVKYEHDMTTDRDIRNQIAFSREEGLKEGLEKGMEKGARETLIEMAKKMVANGNYSEEQIKEFTGLFPSEYSDN